MTLRRTTTKNAAPIRYLELSPNCEICGRHRSAGSHVKCSRIRKAHYDVVKGRVGQ